MKSMVLDGPALERLTREVKGAVIDPSHPRYDDARRVFNATIDRRPAAILLCHDDDDVVTGVSFARQQKLDLAVRGGAHNVAGNAVCDNGLVIDLSAMRRVAVDVRSRKARCQGGATWGDFDR